MYKFETHQYNSETFFFLLLSTRVATFAVCSVWYKFWQHGLWMHVNTFMNANSTFIIWSSTFWKVKELQHAPLLHNRWLHPAVNFPTQGRWVRHDVTRLARRMRRGKMEDEVFCVLQQLHLSLWWSDNQCLPVRVLEGGKESVAKSSSEE